jgi:hypothetical protein
LTPTAGTRATPTAPSSSQTEIPATVASERAAAIGFLGVELQPEDPMPGGQVLWIENVSMETVQLHCWSIRSLPADARWIIGEMGELAPDSIARLTIIDGALSQTEELQLVDPQGRLAHQTPKLSDTAYDDQIWFLSPEGDWQYGRTLFSEDLIDLALSNVYPEDC